MPSDLSSDIFCNNAHPLAGHGFGLERTPFIGSGDAAQMQGMDHAGDASLCADDDQSYGFAIGWVVEWERIVRGGGNRVIGLEIFGHSCNGFDVVISVTLQIIA